MHSQPITSRDPRCPEMQRPVRRTPKSKRTGQLDLRFKGPAKPRPEDIVRKHLLDVLPPGAPPGFTSISDAELWDAGAKRSAVATVTMMDGLKSRVEVFGWGVGLAGHRWLSWEGGDLCFEGGRWIRVNGDEP